MTPNLSDKINGYLDTEYLDNQIKIKLHEFSFFKKPISNTKALYRTITVLRCLYANKRTLEC